MRRPVRPQVVTNYCRVDAATTAARGAAQTVVAGAGVLPPPGTRIKQPDCQAGASGAASPIRDKAMTGDGPWGPWS